MPLDAGGAPILVGLLHDFPQADGGASFEAACRLGVEEVGKDGRIDRPVHFITRQARGLPLGTAHEVEAVFTELAGNGVVAIIGPSISDNSLVVRAVADAIGLPTINYSGGEQTRSEFLFHYQVGSLAEEPVVLAEHLLAEGHSTAAAVYDRSPVGRGYMDAFEEAAARAGIDVVARAPVSPIADDASAVVARLQSPGPDALVYLGLGMASRTLALAVDDADWKIPVVANSALMFGYAHRDWRDGFEGWVYVDTVADDNATRQRLREMSRHSAAGPIGVAAYDMGRLLGEGIARADHLTRSGLRDGLESVKRLPAASGHPGTTMGFGPWDHAALKGPFLVLREWRDGHTVQR
jgi:ABC-type branched-subunit amino acid transport system substrate-binding protein